MSDSVEELEAFTKIKSDGVSMEKIMDKFIVADKNLILKTDIENSKNFTILLVIAQELKDKGLVRSSKTIKRFCDWYIRVRISNHRLSRKEILDAISAIKRESATQTIGAKILGLGKKDES